MLRYKIDVLAELKEKGYTTYKINKDKLLSNSTVQKLRRGTMVSSQNIDTLCEMLCCQPGDIIEYIKM